MFQHLFKVPELNIENAEAGLGPVSVRLKAELGGFKNLFFKRLWR
jgi:hypothetical protein